MNPYVGLIGLLGVAIMFAHSLVKHPGVKAVPAQLLVLIATVPLAMWFEFGRARSYVFAGAEHRVGPEFLVNVPANLFSAITFPDFGGVLTATGLKYIVLFSIIGSLESLLSAKAVEQIDPWHRKTNHDRDLLAVGVGNTLAALVGGLPMISEIVRSKANIDNGARTRFANLFHGVFLLLFVALVPVVDPSDPIGRPGGHAGLHGVPPRLASRRSHTCTTWAGSSWSSSWRRSSASWPPTCWWASPSASRSRS